MPYRRTGFLASAVVTAVAALGAAAPVAMAAAPATVKLQHSSSPAASRTPSVGDVPASTSIPFSVNLALSDPQGAQSFAQAVSTPGNASYRKYLTAAQWEARYAPSAQSVQTAAQIEKVFATSLSYHQVQGDKLRLATQNLAVPADVAGVISE